MVTLVAAVEELEMVSSWLWTVLMNMDDTNISPSNWKYGHYLTWDCKEMKSEACLARKASSVGAHRVPFSSVQSLSHVRLFVTPWIAARQASLSITKSRSSLRLMSIESVMPSSHLILCRTLFRRVNSLVIRKIQINTTVKHHNSSFGMAFSFY